MELDGNRPLNVLVVDDHPDTTHFLSRLLMRSGHTVLQANDYASALAAARGIRADLLICDIGLGGGRDGCDLLAEVLSLYPLKSLALTGHDTPEVGARIARAGFDAHLTKPVVFEELFEAIAAVTKTSDRASEANHFGMTA